MSDAVARPPEQVLRRCDLLGTTRTRDGSDKYQWEDSVAHDNILEDSGGTYVSREKQ